MISGIVRNEEAASRHINIASHHDDVTLLDKNDRLIQIIRLKGIDCISNDDASLAAYKNRVNNLLKGFSSEFAIYCWEVRRRSTDYPDGEFAGGYAKELNERYKRKMQSAKLFSNDLYLAIITKQPEGFINSGLSVIQQFKSLFDKKHRSQYLERRHAELCEMTGKVMSALADYGCELLSVQERNGARLSEPLQFLSQIISIDPHPVPVVEQDAGMLLASKRLSFSNRSGIVEFRNVDGSSRFAAMLAIKGYSPRTIEGMLDEIGKLQCEYLITQSFRFYDRENAKGRVRNQQKEMQQTKDTSISETFQLDESFDEAASGEVGLGLHHFVLACYADTREELDRHVSMIHSRFTDLDIICVREDVACECAFWSQLPGNFAYALRAVPISTRNMAGFMNLHNYHRGRRDGNHWGSAVTMLETIAGTPYYFNFHHRDVGNFLVFGAMGSGKTVLTGFLIAQSMKLGGRRVIFDKDRGLEVAVRAMGGVYERIRPGIATGFNPCKLEDTPENRAFLVSLFAKMLTVNNESVTEADNEIIVRAVDGIWRQDEASRQLCHIAPYFGARKSGSLRNRFDQWHSDGQFAWLFDNADDSLNLNSDVLGFDLGSILNDANCKTPAIMYLMHRVQQSFAGQHGIIFFDEGWHALNDPVFADIFNDLGRTPRKKNIVFGLATQSANDTVASSISKAINESARCKIFFPNPSADHDTYVNHFGLTEHEYNHVKTLPDDQHYFLLVHGHGINRETVIARLDLSDMQDDIAIISGREHSVLLLEKIISETGDDPANWIPVFVLKMRRQA